MRKVNSMKSNKSKEKSSASSGKTRVLPLVTVIIIALAACLIVGMVTGNIKLINNENLSKPDTVRLRLEDIGQLNTQEAYVTEINSTKDAKQLFGVDVPFTKSTLIYSYNFKVTAGYDFSQIELNETPGGSSDKKSIVTVSMPAAQVTGTEPVKDSLKVYEENESVFNRISLSENDEALNNMRDQAEKDAVANGLLDAAQNNAKTLLTSFLQDVYPQDKYEIRFQDNQSAGGTDTGSVDAQSTDTAGTSA
jgi:hypothetical protein